MMQGCQAIDDRFAEVILTPRAPVLVYPIAPNRRREYKRCFKDTFDFRCNVMIVIKEIA